MIATDCRLLLLARGLFASTVLAMPAAVGCGPAQPDFGGAVVVPEPGTSSTIEKAQGDPMFDPAG